MKLEELLEKRKTEKQFTCSCCGGVFDYEVDPEICEKEAIENGFKDMEDLEVICQDCFDKVNDYWGNPMKDLTKTED